MAKLVPLSIAAGIASALCYLSSEWSPVAALIFTLAAPMPLFAAGLGLGLTGAIVAAVTGTVTAAAAAGLMRAGIYAAMDAVPVVILVRLALLNRTTPEGTVEWYPPGRLLGWLSAYGAAAFVALALAVGPDELQGGIADYLDALRRLVPETGRDGEAVARLVAGLARVLPFLVATWWIVVMAANAVLAQRLLARAGHALRPSPDFTTTAPPAWVMSAAVAAAALALVGSGRLGFLATNVALILCVPYFLTGLAVIHAISARWNGRTAILIALYLLIVLFGWPLIVVTGLGMVEHWIGLRARHAAPGQGKERNE